MKIILSRKGFDSSNGGCASPILTDRTLLSLPIPQESDASLPTYADLQHDGRSYAELLKKLSRKAPGPETTCHLDPDLRKIDRDMWKPAFGQCDSAQTYLSRRGVGPGDLFLFFGWFRGAEFKTNGDLRYIRGKNGRNLQVIYGYMEIGEVLTDQNEIAERYPWHPHARHRPTPNALYIPTERLSMDPSLPGCGVLDFQRRRVLTAEGATRAQWDITRYPFLMPEHLLDTNRKNSARHPDRHLYYAGVWQELVYKPNVELEKWALSIIRE